MKICVKCNLEKTFKEFYIGKGNQDGYRSSCKDCIKKYQQDNKDAKSKYLKKYKEDKKDILILKNKEYREKNKEKIQNWKEENKHYFKKYRQENKDKIRKYYKENKDRVSKTNRLYRQRRTKEDAVYRFSRTIRSLVHGAFKRGTNQFRKEAKTEKILGCTIEEFRLYIESQFTKRMTLENHGEWHLDHILPLATAKTEEDIIRLNHYTNFQPLWAKDNILKSNKIIEKQLVLL